MWKFLSELKRVALDLVLAGLILALYGSGLHEHLSETLQLVVLKTLLVSMGIMSGHISGKLIWPKVNWAGMMTPAHYARIALYVVCVYAYSLGG